QAIARSTANEASLTRRNRPYGCMKTDRPGTRRTVRPRPASSTNGTTHAATDENALIRRAVIAGGCCAAARYSGHNDPIQNAIQNRWSNSNAAAAPRAGLTEV